MPNAGQADFSAGNSLQAKAHPSDSVHHEVGARTATWVLIRKASCKSSMWGARVFKQQHAAKRGRVDCSSQHLLPNTALPLQTSTFPARDIMRAGFAPKAVHTSRIKGSTQTSPRQFSRICTSWAILLKVSLPSKGMSTLNKMCFFPPIHWRNICS